MYTDKKVFSSLFLIQLFASFLVLAGHYTADVDDYIEWTFWEEALNQISRYGTVLLTIITGFFTAHSLSGKKARGKQFFSGKITYIYIPFLISSILYFLILKNRFPQTLQDIKEIFLGDAAGHLYFIFMICQYYVFAYFCRRFITKKNIFFVCLLFLGIQYTYINIVGHGWFGVGVRHFLPTWIFTIYLGHFLYWYRIEFFRFIEKHWMVPFGLIGLSGLSMGYFVVSPKLYTANHLIFVFATFILLLASVTVCNYVVDRLYLRFQKGLTFYIYLFHPVFIIFFNRFMKANFSLEWILHNKGMSALYLVSIYAATFLFSWFCMKIMKKGMMIFTNRKQNETIKIVLQSKN
jgi:hypothetical protein